MPNRINRNNEDLVGKHFRLPGSISLCVVEDIDAEREGILRALNINSAVGFDADAYAVRAAINNAVRHCTPAQLTNRPEGE